MRSAAFHDVDFDEDLLRFRGDFDEQGDAEFWWGDETTPADTILGDQNVPPEAIRMFYAMVGRCMFDINGTCQHPDEGNETSLSTRLEAILFLWGRVRSRSLSPSARGRLVLAGLISSHSLAQGGTGKSTLIKLITLLYNNDPLLVGQLENQSQAHFGLAKIRHSSLVVAPDVDSKFSLDPTILTSMTSGAFHRAVST